MDSYRQADGNSRQPLFYQQKEAGEGSNVADSASQRTCESYIQKLMSTH